MIRNLVTACLIFFSLTCFAQDDVMPAAIQVMPGGKLILHSYAKGVQVYVCRQDPKDTSRYSWTLKEPRANLYADSGFQHLIGKHYYNQAGSPTWEDLDDSIVSGVKLQQSNSTDKSAIPWLLLKAVATNGKGVLKNTAFIQRLYTKGGKAPVSADKMLLAETLEVPYTAEYLFYSDK